MFEPLGQLAGGVVLVGGAALVKAGFFDQAVAHVVGEAGAVVVFVDEGGQAPGGVVFIARAWPGPNVPGSWPSGASPWCCGR